MDVSFSSPLPQSCYSYCCSPSGSAVAAALGSNLYIRDAQTLQVLFIHPCIDKIERVEWSPDSCYILCALYKRAAVQMFSLLDPEWRCRINEGAAGLVYASWAHDSRHVITCSDFQVQLTVWSLCEQKSYYVPRPKTAPGCYAFTESGDLMAVAQRIDSKDHVGVYSCRNWEELSKFRVQTHDVSNILWARESRNVILVDTLLVYRVLVYTFEGELVSEFKPYEHALGVKSVQMSPNGAMLALGSFDERARLMTCLNWRTAFEYVHVHPRDIPDGLKCRNMQMLVEVTTASEQQVEEGWANFSVSSSARNVSSLTLTNKKPTQTRHVEGSVPRLGLSYVSKFLNAIPSVRPDPRKAPVKMGVGLLAWSYDGRYLATRNDNMSSTLWIWDTQGVGLRDVCVQLEPIRAARWAQHSHLLAFCTDTARVYFWTPMGASWIDVPFLDFKVVGLRWHSAGTKLALLSRDSFTTTDLNNFHHLHAKMYADEGDAQAKAEEHDNVDVVA